MRSRSYAAFAIKDIDGTRRIAVIVFESIEPKGLDRDKIKHALDSVEERRIAEFLQTWKAFEPDLSYATKEGF